MAKKKKVNKQTYDEMMQSSGKATTYEGMMSDKDRFNRKGVYSAIANDIKKREEQKEQNLSNARTKTWQGVTANARWDSQGDRSGEAYAAKMIRDTPGAYEREKKKLIDGLTAGTTAWKNASQDAKYGADGQDNSHVIYAAKMIRDSSQKEDKSVELNKFLSGLKENKLKIKAAAGRQGETYQEAASKDAYKRYMQKLQEQKAEQEKNGQAVPDNGISAQKSAANRVSVKTTKNFYQDLNDRMMKGEFDNEEDSRNWSLDKKKEELKSNQEQIGQLQKEMDDYGRMLEEAQSWEPTVARESAGQLYDDLAGMGMAGTVIHLNRDRAVSAIDDLYENGFDLSDDDNANRAYVFNRLYGTSYGNHYQQAIDSMDDEQRAWLDDKLDEIIESINGNYDTDALAQSYQDAWGNLTKYQNQNAVLEKNIASWDTVNDMMQNAPTGTYEPLKPDYSGRKGTIFQQMAYDPRNIKDDADRLYWDIQDQQSGWYNMSTAEKNAWLKKITGVDVGAGGLADAVMDRIEATGAYYAFMTPKMVDTFNQYYLSGDKASAIAFMNALKGTGYLEAALRKHLENKAYEDATGPYGEVFGLLSVPDQLLTSTAGVPATIAALLGNKEAQDQNNAVWANQAAIQSTREGRGNVWGERAVKLFGDWAREPAKFLTNVAYSMLDNAAAMGVGKWLGGGDINKTMRVVQLIMSSEATSNTMLQQLDDGKNPAEAAVYAIGDGIIEWFTERYSLEQLLKPDVKGMLGNGKQLAKFLFKTGAAEGSEEIASDLLNMGLDYVLSAINGHKNEIQAAVDKMVADGADPQDALGMVLKDKFKETMLSGLAGAISGLGMGGGRIAANTVSNFVSGKNIKSNTNIYSGKNSEKALVELAKNMPGTMAEEQANKISEELEKGEGVSNQKLGKLAQTIEMEASEVLQKAQDGEQIAPDEVQKSLKTLQSVAEIKGNLKEGSTGTVRQSNLHMATMEDIQAAEDSGSQRTNSSREAIYDGKFADIQGIKVEKVDGKWQTRIQIDGQTVDVNEVQPTNYATAQIINQAAINPEFYSERFTNKMLQAAEAGQISDNDVGKALQEGMLARVYAYAGESYSKVKTEVLPQQLASEIYMDSLQEHGENRKAQVAEANHMQTGRVTYDGVEYGTEAWAKKTADLDAKTKNWMDTIAGIAQRAGIQADFTYLNNDKETYGWESKSGIGLNINGRNFERNTKGKVVETGTHNMMVTFGHEMTHWLQRNSLKGYNRLEQYVMQQYIQNNGTDQLIRRLNQHMFQNGYSLEDSISEIVADSCDQILNNEQVRDHIANTDQSLFKEIKGFVQDLVSRFKKAVLGMKESASSDAISMARNMNEIAKIWLGAYDEAISGFVDQGKEKNTVEKRYSKAGIDPDTGRSVYISNFSQNTQNDNKRYRIVKLMRKVWSKNPINLKIIENGKERIISAKYDPTFDTVHNSKDTDIYKMAFANKMGTPHEKTVMLNLADDYYQILQEATYDNSKEDVKDPTKTHNADMWHYFIDDIYYADKDSDVMNPYRITINIREVADEDFVYSYSAEKQANENKKLSAPVIRPGSDGTESGEFAQPSANTIAENKQKDNIRKSKALEKDLQESNGTETAYGDHAKFSRAVTDPDELKFLNGQKTIKTYKTMQLIDGKLYPPMAAVVAGSMEDASTLGQWEKATEHPELIKDGNKFTLNKGKGKGSLAAAYNPYMHSSNLMINDQFSGAYNRDNLVTVECEVPVSEMDSGYHAEYAKDSVGWHSWHTGPVAGQIRQQKGTERQVFLSRWIKPVRIVSDAEVAQHYKELLEGTDIAVPDNVVTPQLRQELIKAGVKVQESGRVRYSRAVINQDGEDVTLPAMDLSRTFYFKGTDADIDAGEAKIAAREQEMKDIIEDPSFTALMLQDKPYGRYEILHPSTRKGVQFQLTYYGPDGIPNMHESYGRTGTEVDEHENIHDLSELYRHFADQSFDAPLKMKVLRENAMQGMKFSKAQVDQTRDLIAYHNLGAEQLMKVLELGGFAMPSIGITKTDYVNDRYGEISVIFKKDTIDPKKNRANKVYGGDAWTPTYPTIEYKISDKKLAQILKKVKSLIPAGMKADYVDLYEDNMQTNVNRSSGDVVKAVKDNASLMAAYLADKGEQINMPMREKALDGFGKFSNEMVIRVANVIGQDVVQQAYVESANTYQYMKEHPELIEQIRNELNAYWKEELKKKVSEGTRMKLLDKELYTEDNFGANAASNIIEAAWKYFDRGVEQQLDEYALKDSMREQIDEADYEKWLQDLFDGIIEKKGIRNNKGYYTDSGNQRSWESLHDEETLENVVKVMKAQMDKASNAFFGQSAMLALGTRDLKSIDEIKAHKGQLQHISDEELSEAKHNIVDQFSKLMDDLANPNERNIFIARDQVLDAMVDAVRNSRTVQGITRQMKEWGYNISNEQAQLIVDLMEEIADLPTEYFEAKPQRGVGLNEIYKVLVTEDTNQELLEALDNQNIPYEYYDGTTEDRLRVMNEQDEAKFSKWTPESMDVNAWLAGASISTFQTEDERIMWQAWKDLRMKIQISMKRQLMYQEQIKALEKKADLTAEERDQLTALRNKLEVQKNKMARLEDDLQKVTSDEGYAGMMYRNNIVLGDYIAGKTQDQVRQTVEQMVKEVQQAKAEIEKQSEELKKLAQTQAVKTMQSFFGKTSLGRMASMLRKYYNSSMQKSEIQARLAELAMKQANGEDISDGAMALAVDLVDKIRGIRSDAIEQIRGTTFIIGQSLLDELKAENSSLQEIRSKVKGSGVKFQVGVKDSQTGRIVDKNSRISEQWQELRDKNGALPDVDGMAEIDKLHTIVDFIANEMSKSRGAEQFGINMDEAELFVRSAVGNVTTYLVDNPAARKQIENLMGQIRDLSNRTGRIAGTMDQLSQKMTDVETAGIKAKGWTTVLQRDVGDAIRYYNKMAQVAAQHEKQKVKTLLIDQLKSENTAKLIKQQRKYEQMMKDDRTARQLAMDNEMLRRRIHTVTNRMAQRLFAETDIKNIPEETKPLARLVLGMIEKNDSIYRRATYYNRAQLNDMHQRLLKMIATFGDFDYNSDLDWLIIKGPTEADDDYDAYYRIAQDLQDIEQGLLEYHNAEGQRNITLMDRKNALTKVQTALSEIWSAIQARGQAEIDGRKWQVMELALQMDEDMQGSKFKGERIGKTRKVKDAVTNAVGYGNLTPVYFIKNLKNRTMSLLYRGLETGENRSGLEVRKAQAAIEKIATETGFINWDGQEKHKVNVSGGKTIELTTEQIMALYATWKRESNQMRPEETSHLRNGGFVISEDLDKGISGRKKIEQVPIRMSKDALNSLGSYLTDAQREYVDRIVEYLSTDMAELGNEASMRMYGIKKFTEQFYFPIKSWGGVMNSRSDAGVRNNNENRAAQQGFSKRVRANANNAIEIGDFTPTAMKHIAGMINYNTVGPAIENINKVLNQQLQYGELTEEEDTRYKRNMRTAFQQHYGTQAYKYLEKFMGDMNGGVNRGQGNNVWDKLLGVFKKMSVAGSLSVAAQQPLSYIRAAMLINPKYLAKALATEWKGAYKELMQYSGLAVIKDMGRFDMNYGQSAAEYITPEAKMSKGKAMWKWLGDKSTALPQKMDALTWTRMWVAVKAEQAALHPEMDVRGEEFLNMAAERFNDVMRRTQVYDSVMVKSQNMRNQHSFAKTITSFMAEPTLSLNVLADAWQNKGEKGGKANAVKALGLIALSAIAQAAVKGFFSTGRTPDKKKNQEENFLYKFTYNLMSEANILGMIPGFSQLMDLLQNGELTDNSLSVVGKAKDAISEIGKMIKGGEEYKWYRGVEDSIGQLLQMATNIPAKNFMRDLRAMGNFFSGGRLESITGGTYANRKTSPAVLKYQLIDQLMTEDLIGVVNKELGDAGYGTKNEDYYKRIYNAEKAGNTQDAEDMKEYLLMGKGVKDEKAINDAMKGLVKTDDSLSASEKVKALRERGMRDQDIAEWVMKQYQEGKLERQEAEKLWLEANPIKNKNDAYYKFEQQDWEKETGENIDDTQWFRLNAALDSGSSSEYSAAVKELKAHGYNEEKINDHVKTQIVQKYKDGKLTKKQTETELKKYRKDLTDDDIYWTLDLIDYKKETGNKDASGKYYRLTDAVNANKAEQIQTAVKELLAHGITKEKIKSKLSAWKQEYLAADTNGRRKIRDALEKAYRAAGYTAADADKMITNWTKDNKKK